MTKVLVTGGCGYIGSHTIVNLVEAGYEVISVDSNINSSPKSIEAVSELTGKKIKSYTIDLCDKESLTTVFDEHSDIKAIIHFAALKAVGQSVEQPMLYFQNNMSSLMNVVELAKDYEVENLVFSSSCTVYGETTDLPVTEMTPMQPAESPYGRTKQLGEYMLQDVAKFTDVKVVSLRYFNPAGAHPSGAIGEAPTIQALSLVPVIVETAAGKREKCTVFGDDYDTRDGSCVRDYIHVVDLADAHVRAVDKMIENGMAQPDYDVYNLGIGAGVTVLEAISAFEKVSSTKLNYEIGPRRGGDIVAIYSNYDKAAKELKWQPKYDIEDIMRSAWVWENDRKY